jgi:beta-glucosidase
VKNAGTRSGEEVVQMYVKHLNSSVERPLLELKGFIRIPLAPGQKTNVTFTLPANRLAYWKVTAHRYEIEHDRVEVAVGGSSANLQLKKTIQVTAR